MTQQKRPNEWCQVSSATQWIGTPTALAIVGGTCSELEAKDKIILAIQNDLVRMSSPLIIHEGDVGEPYPKLSGTYQAVRDTGYGNEVILDDRSRQDNHA